MKQRVLTTNGVRSRDKIHENYNSVVCSISCDGVL